MTRADFYVGRGENAEWLGSIASDGYPTGHVAEDDTGIVVATDEQVYRKLVAVLIEKSGDGTKPEQGWPWPWENSRSTDYAYAFDGGKVWASNFGRSWFDPTKPEDHDRDIPKSAVFPDMTARKKVTLGPRSGLIVFGLLKE